jgi:hypothetical protein
MKLLIAGSRTIEPNPQFLKGLILTYVGFPDEIVSGGADGVDAAAKYLTEVLFVDSLLEHRLKGKYKEFPADWNTHGKAAGPIRNKQMADYSDALLLIWDGESRGSKNMKETMLKLGKPVFEVVIKTHNVKEQSHCP